MNRFKPLDILTTPLTGTNLIEASAGTGKTFTISNLYLRLVIEKKYDVKNILVVTYTEAATKELRDRIRKNLGEALSYIESKSDCSNIVMEEIVDHESGKTDTRDIISILRKAMTCFDEAAVFTIHGFCRRILSDNSFESALNFDTELITEQRLFIQEIADDFWRKEFSSKPALPAALAKKNQLGPTGLISFSKELINKPLLNIIPENIESSHEKMIQIFQKMGEEWESNQEEIKEILYHDKGVKRARNTYKIEMLDEYMENMNFIFSKEPVAEYIDAVRMFSSQMIHSSMKKNNVPPGHHFFNLCDEFIQAEKEYVGYIKLKFAEYLKNELKVRKQESNVQSFDDLLTTLRDALRSENGKQLKKTIRQKFKAALIDEFQDTDPVQYDIFRTIFFIDTHSLFLIGDPKQSIYGFRGADIFSYIDAAKSTPDNNTFTLGTNWRSESSLVEAVNRFFNHIDNPFVFGKAIPYIDVKAAEESVGNRKPLVVHSGDGTDREGDDSLILWFLKNELPSKSGKGPNKADAGKLAAMACVSEIARLLSLSEKGMATIGDKPILPSDIAILVTRNKDALLFKDTLQELNIPAVLKKSGNIFQTEETKEVVLILSAIASPGNHRYLNAALSTSLIGITGEEICTFVENEKKLSDYESHLERFHNYYELWNNRGFIRMFRKFMHEYGVRQRLLKLPYGERRLTNVLQFSELIHTAVVEERLGINGVLSWISDQRITMEESEDQEIRLERDDDAVQILTVFKSKGLQYPIVFCPFMWQTGAIRNDEDIIFHDENTVYLDIGTEKSEEAGAQAGKERLSELVRLLYVALTRAQNRCYLTCGKIGNPSANALDYIFIGGMDEKSDIIGYLTEKLKKMDEDELFLEVNRMARKSNSLIHVADTPSPVTASYLSSKNYTQQDLTLRKSTGKISRDWGIASYSTLVSGEKKGHAGADSDVMKKDETLGNISGYDEDDAKGFFAFPRGALPGTCIHTVFEELDFREKDPENIKSLILNTLISYGLNDTTPVDKDGGDRVDSVYDMVRRVLDASILSQVVSPVLPKQNDFALHKIAVEHRITELEFFYPIKQITSKGLQDILQAPLSQTIYKNSELPLNIGKLEFRPIHGFMHGFVDLLFCYNEKYYVLDWKTNHLGNRFEDYNQDRLQTCMEESLYTLQYYIYSVAVHKYLASRLLNYDFDTHFGGVLYLFVRGIHPDYPGNGIFYDLPSKEAVEAMCGLCE